MKDVDCAESRGAHGVNEGVDLASMCPGMPSRWLSRRALVSTVVATGLTMASREQSVTLAEQQAKNTAVSVRAEFGSGADYPIVKSKFAVFNSCIVPVSTYERDSAFFGIAKPESLRIDLGWGADWAGWSEEPIQGTAQRPTLHLQEMDRIAEIINAHGTLPYWSYCYTPAPLQDPPGAWRSVPERMADWGTILSAVARHYRELRNTNPVGYHEVFNEPDNSDFTVGTMHDYFDIYEHAAPAIRHADPEALVGGPALAFTKEWIDPFVDLMAAQQLPFDFFSTHVYGTNDLFQGLDTMLDASRESLDRYPQFSTVEIHLNEFNSYPIDYPIDGTQQKHRLAAAFLRDMTYFLERPEVTLVHWAQFLDSGMGNFSGMVSIDGHRKAVFNAAAIYARLPVDRVALHVDGPPDLSGLAGIQGHRAGIVLWNLAPGKKAVALTLSDLPFSTGVVREYRIDSEHASWGDGTATESLEPVVISGEVALSDFTWNGEVAGGGVMYLEIDDTTGISEPDSVDVARWLRTLHYYPNRSTTAYADFDKHMWTFRLGTVDDGEADVQIGVTAEDLPDEIMVEVQIDGDPKRLDADSQVGLRVDYFTGNAYTESVVFHGPHGSGPDIFDAERALAMPWGTMSSPDQHERIADFSAFRVAVKRHAPTGWTGRVQVTAILSRVGPNVRARIVLRRT
jgi:xylan 1,4-beta-xylosidase